MKKSIIMILLVSILMFVCHFMTVSAAIPTKDTIKQRLDSLKSQYPDGTSQTKFYNAQIYDSDIGGYSMGYKDLSGYGSWQCLAWGCKVYDTLWEKSISTGETHTNVNNICIGDYVRYNSTIEYDHSIIITGIDGNTLYYTDCNGGKVGSVSYSNKIKWDRTISKSELQTKVNKKLVMSSGYGYIRHQNGNDYKDLNAYVNLGGDFYAKIKNTYYGLCLTNDSDNVSVRTDSNSDSQWWHFIRNSDGTYKIISMKDTSKCLDVHLSGTGIKTNIKVATDNGGNAQKWAITGSQNKYVLRALCTSCVIDVDNITTGDGANVWTYTANGTNVQLFTIESHIAGCNIDLGEDFDAKIINPYYDMCFTNDSINVSMREYKNNENQWWHFVRYDDYSYKIVSYYDNLCLDVHLAGTFAATNIKVAGDNGNNAQKWYIYKNGSRYILRAKCTQHVADFLAASEGANVQTYTIKGTNSQLFDIEKINIEKINFNCNNDGFIIAPKAVYYPDLVNGGRGADKMVIYNNSEQTTGTNSWGTEILVGANGRVEKLEWYKGNATVPHKGFIASGNGTASSWLCDNVEEGDYAVYNIDTNELQIWDENSRLIEKGKNVMVGSSYGTLPQLNDCNGRVFEGWYDSADGGVQITEESAVSVSCKNLYAHWSVPKPKLLAEVTTEGTSYTVRAQINNVSEACDVVIAAYSNKRLTAYHKEDFGEYEVVSTLKGEFDEIKVMAFEKGDSIRPICEAVILIP